MTKKKTNEIAGRSGLILRIVKGIKTLYKDFSSDNLPRIIFAVLILIIIGGGMVFIAESGINKQFSHFIDSLWWGAVTITTVGYGDMTPSSNAGRIIAVIMMFGGIVLTSIFSGTIASIFVDRKIQEGRGLQEVNLRNHTIICGWNRNAIGIIESFSALSKDKKITLCLISEMDAEEFQMLKVKHSELEIKFVKGDFSSEKILNRASASNAKAVIFIPDVSGSNTIENADERTILGVLAVKSINPDITSCAEVLKKENEGHLQRASVDSIIVNGEFSGFLLSNASVSQGIPKFVKEMLAVESEKSIHQVPIPGSFVGKTFLELSEYFLKNNKGIAVGIMSEDKKMSLEDMLSDDSSSIDAFIKRKFQEAEINIGEQQEQSLDIQISPSPDYNIKETDSLFILGAEV
ncbi:MAG: NAD-binding protein [Spirochaetaceae bacterium]|nr:NAD-binding protein [Spirochaetaceae bacterium]